MDVEQQSITHYSGFCGFKINFSGNYNLRGIPISPANMLSEPSSTLCYSSAVINRQYVVYITQNTTPLKGTHGREKEDAPSDHFKRRIVMN